MSSRKITFLLAVSLLSAIVISLVEPGRIFLTEWLRKTEVLNTPFRELAQDLSPEVDKVDCVIAENHTLAGNLRLWFPNKLVLDPEVGPLFSPGPRKALVIWNADHNGSPPYELLNFTRSFTREKRIGQTKAIEEPLKYHHHRMIHLGAASIP